MSSGSSTTSGVSPGTSNGPGGSAPRPPSEANVRPATPPTGGRPPYPQPGAGIQGVNQPVYGLGMIFSLIVALIVFVLALFIIGDAKDEGLPINENTGPLFWFVAAITVLVSGAGAQYAERTAAQAAAGVGRPRPATALPTAWAVPVVATVAAILLVATYHNGTMLVAGPLLAFLGNAGALLSRDLLDDASDSTQRTATTIHTLVIHAVAFLALSAVYLNKMPPPTAALLTGVITGLLTLETLERGDASPPRRLLFALLAGAVVAEVTIALNWWQTHGWTGGAVLLVCFYLAAGVLLASTQRTVLRGRDLIEFGLVSLIAFVVLAVTA